MRLNLKRAAVALFPLTALLFPLRSAGAEAEPLSLSIKDGIIRVIENNLDITIERVSPEIREADIVKETGAFDIESSGSFKRSDSSTPLNARSSVSLGGLTELKSKTYNLSAGLSGRLQTGAVYSLEVRDAWTADTLNQFRNEYSSFTGAKVTQPLLKNLGRDVNTSRINIAKKDRDMSIYRFKHMVLETVAGYESAYWELVRAKEEAGLKKESLKLAGTLLLQNIKRLNSGVIPPIEVTQAEAAAAARKDDLILAEKLLRERGNAMKLMISKDVYTLKDTVIEPADRPEVRRFEASLEESVKAAFSSRPDYLEIKSGIEKTNISIRYAENQRLPQVDIEASYGFNGLGSSLSGSFSNVADNPEWSLGVMLRYPIGNSAADGQMRAARLEAGLIILRLKQLEQRIIMNIDNAIRDIRANTERIEAAKVATKLSEESLAAEEKKLSAGRSTTYNVLKVQEDLIKARTNELAGAIDLNKAIINFLKEKGTLLDELGINIGRTPAVSW
ncbi:MAG: TolC family protein [Deltaproteobacteria bacterium]|nr:TolC family protein [Deltaproteobacteria bacterium]